MDLAIQNRGGRKKTKRQGPSSEGGGAGTKKNNKRCLGMYMRDAIGSKKQKILSLFLSPSFVRMK
jgi:hypothetical protein